MSALDRGFGYAQARLQARLGRRAWHRDLKRARAGGDLATYLHLVRPLVAPDRLARVSPKMGSHEIERRLREDWFTTVEEVVRFVPDRWRAATAWLRWLPYLPVLQARARGGALPSWTRDDAVIAAIVCPPVEPERVASGEVSTAALRACVDSDGDVTEAWIAHWRRLWPDVPRHGPALRRLVNLVLEASNELRRAASGTSSDRVAGTFEQRVLRLFRRHPLSPATACAYLALQALEHWELRGALARRSALAAPS